MQEEIFTIDEVSKYLKIPKSTIYKLSQKGQMPSCKIGKQLRFRKSSLDKWLTAKETGSKTIKQDLVVLDKDEPSSHRPRHILLIDDDALVLKAITRLLNVHGYNVVPAESGEEALKKAGDLHFDLIITDVRMPGIDGIETIKRIRELRRSVNRPQAPEIIITGFTDSEAERRATDLGITDYVYKPFSNTDFLNTVERKLEYIDN